MQTYNVKSLAFKNGVLNPPTVGYTEADLEIINQNNVEGQMWFNKYTETLYINFLGSNESEDWKKNFKFEKTKYYLKSDSNKYVKIHTGFYMCYLEVLFIMLQKIDNTLPKKIVFAGHSLGGAISLVAGVLLQDQFPNMEIEINTFGCPRVGNLAFKRAARSVSKIRQFRMNGDMVARIPFIFPFLGVWFHPVKQINLGFHKHTKWYSFWLDHTPYRYDDNIGKIGWGNIL